MARGHENITHTSTHETHLEPREADIERQTAVRHEMEETGAEKQHDLKERRDQTPLVEAEARKLAKKAEDDRPIIEAHVPEKRRPAPTRKQRDKVYKSTLKDLQQDMGTASRLTSKFIHSRPVEATSDFAASTVARPNALLAGSISAFIFVTLTYFFAKSYGYALSGFETLGSFAIGWVIGILYDYFSGLVKRR